MNFTRLLLLLLLLLLFGKVLFGLKSNGSSLSFELATVSLSVTTASICGAAILSFWTVSVSELSDKTKTLVGSVAAATSCSVVSDIKCSGVACLSASAAVFC